MRLLCAALVLLGPIHLDRSTLVPHGQVVVTATITTATITMATTTTEGDGADLVWDWGWESWATA
jgi:hypothetical protein